MKYIDLTVQTLLLTAGLCMVGAAAVAPQRLTGTLWIYYLLGTWQYGSSFMATIRGSFYWRAKRTHLALASVYLLLLPGMQLALPAGSLLTAGPLLHVLLLLPPLFLAVYYYVVSWKCLVRRAKKQSSFLPHTSF